MLQTRISFLRAFVVLFVAFHALASAAATGTSSWYRHPNVCELLLTSYGDDFMIPEELEDFWGRHPRFGIVRKDGRHLLVTRDEATSRKLRSDLAAYASALGEPARSPSDAKPATLDELRGAVVYDVTDLLPAKARQLHERNTTTGNCWNLACYNTGVASGIFNMVDNEFTFWLSSPLARKLGPAEPPLPGDVVAFRAMGKTSFSELHGLIYVSDDLVFSKNGAAEGYFRLQDANEVLYLYGPGMAETAKLGLLGKSKRPPVIQSDVYRMTSLDDYVAAHHAGLSPQLLDALAKLRTAERDATVYHVEPDGEMDAAFQQRWRAALREMMNLRDELKKLHAEVTPTLASRGEAERFLWQALGIRLDSLL